MWEQDPSRGFGCARRNEGHPPTSSQRKGALRKSLGVGLYFDSQLASGSLLKGSGVRKEKGQPL